VALPLPDESFHEYRSTEWNRCRFVGSCKWGVSPNNEMGARLELVLSACAETFSICMPDTKVDAMLMVTDQTTLIGHLTLDQYASLREIAAVTEMYVTE